MLPTRRWGRLQSEFEFELVSFRFLKEVTTPPETEVGLQEMRFRFLTADTPLRIRVELIFPRLKRSNFK